MANRWKRERYFVTTSGEERFRSVRQTKGYSMYAYDDGTWVVLKDHPVVSERIAGGGAVMERSPGRLVLAKRAACDALRASLKESDGYPEKK